MAKRTPSRPPKVVALTLRLPVADHHALVGLHARDGVTVTESIRRAIHAWLVAKKALPPPRTKGKKL
jgi:hypothetical protein